MGVVLEGLGMVLRGHQELEEMGGWLLRNGVIFGVILPEFWVEKYTKNATEN